MQARPVSAISMEASEIESVIMEPPLPTYPQTESSSLSHTETMYVYSDGTEACTVASVPDSMLPERTSAGIIGLSSIKSAAEVESSTSIGIKY